jgi:hypothetical protein
MFERGDLVVQYRNGAYRGCVGLVVRKAHNPSEIFTLYQVRWMQARICHDDIAWYEESMIRKLKDLIQGRSKR